MRVGTAIMPAQGWLPRPRVADSSSKSLGARARVVHTALLQLRRDMQAGASAAVRATGSRPSAPQQRPLPEPRRGRLARLPAAGARFVQTPARLTATARPPPCGPVTRIRPRVLQRHVLPRLVDVAHVGPARLHVAQQRGAVLLRGAPQLSPARAQRGKVAAHV